VKVTVAVPATEAAVNVAPFDGDEILATIPHSGFGGSNVVVKVLPEV
jgi:hypothetical protein